MRVHHIYISKDHSFYGHHGRPAGDCPMIEIDEVECVAGKGLVGDRFFEYKPDFKGQVTFFAWEVYHDLCLKFDLVDAPPSIFRRNVIVEGVDLNTLIGEHFEIQGIQFFGVCEASPCYWMNGAVAEGAEKAMEGNGGLRAKILRDGTLRKDPVPEPV